MKIGMLWFDDDPKRTITEKVERAAQHYHAKYGVTPNLCYANPNTVVEDAKALTIKLATAKAGKDTQQVTVRQARSVLPNHFWIGVSEN